MNQLMAEADNDYWALSEAQYLKAQRELSQQEVDRRTAVHDSHNLTPAEQAAILKRSSR